MSRPIKISLGRPSFDEREARAVQRVLESGWVVQGPEVAAFEKELAARHNVKHAIAVSSGTAALHIALKVLDIGPADAVFIPSFAWPAAANMVVQVGARPIFVDVLPDTYNIDPRDLRLQIENCLDDNREIPRAVVPVHQFGLASDLSEICDIARHYRLDMIEDAACALGATYDHQPVGKSGKLAVFSFHPRKAITMGEGGAIVTDKADLAEICRLWRNHGQTMIAGQRDFVTAGFNYRMTEIQAAIGQVQLEKFPQIIKKRKEIAQYYLENLEGSPDFQLPAAFAEHSWQTFMIVLDNNLDRSRIVDTLSEEGIEAGVGSIAAHCLKFYRERFGYRPDDLPISFRLHEKGMALPLHKELSLSDCQQVCDALKRIFAGVKLSTD